MRGLGLLLGRVSARHTPHGKIMCYRPLFHSNGFRPRGGMRSTECHSSPGFRLATCGFNQGRNRFLTFRFRFFTVLASKRSLFHAFTLFGEVFRFAS